jgi:hypothetical protein
MSYTVTTLDIPETQALVWVDQPGYRPCWRHTVFWAMVGGSTTRWVTTDPFNNDLTILDLKDACGVMPLPRDGKFPTERLAIAGQQMDTIGVIGNAEGLRVRATQWAVDLEDAAGVMPFPRKGEDVTIDGITDHNTATAATATRATPTVATATKPRRRKFQ